jgi:predicted metal-dependent HD superfamily phosphohydrolase
VSGDLELEWRALVGASPAAQRAGQDLLARWDEPHRHYHDREHLAAVLAAVDVLASASADHSAGGDAADDTAGADLDAVRLAAWFHDAVHGGHPGDDEEASAELAGTTLSALGLPAGTVAEVERLVLLTATHDPDPGDTAGAVLCDADLAVLGGPSAAYAAYAAAVRAEYADVPDGAFRAGRAAVLERFLGRDPIYLTSAGRHRWETAARRNLSAELAALTR